MFDTQSVGDIALNPPLRKSKLDLGKLFVWYHIKSSCNVLLSMYTFIILTLHLSA